MPKISELPAGGSFDGTDLFPYVKDDVTSYITGTNLVASSPFTSNFLAYLKTGHPVASGGTRLGVPGVSWCGTVQTLAVTANTIYYSPFLVDTAVTVDACYTEVTAAAGTIARLGILACSGVDWQPTSVRQDASTVATTAPAVLSATFTGISLTPGRYLTALVCDGAATFRVIRGSIPSGEVLPALGANALARHHTLAAAGTGALSAANDWDAMTANTVAHDYAVFLRVTSA